ncbi:MAG: hypothetical protein RPU39_05100, partial [Candidatus Sedimenticola sp. (ex Thyasira tokunagai)]
CSAAASFSVPILSALLDNPFIALYAHSHWLLKSHPTGWTTILTEGEFKGLVYTVAPFVTPGFTFASERIEHQPDSIGRMLFFQRLKCHYHRKVLLGIWLIFVGGTAEIKNSTS